MDFSWDDTTLRWRERLLSFMDERVYPAEPVLEKQLADRGPGVWGPPPVIGELRAAAQAAGLWNLFLPGTRGAAGRTGNWGPGLTNLQYAPLAEITGRSPQLAPAALNCAAPDTGNMELLAEFGSPDQQRDWLEPLLAGTIRSGFAMTEPAVASSDATNIETRIVADGDSYVINGHKWFTTGALDPNCAIFIVMGKTDPAAPTHRQQSQILVPRNTPGVEVRRGLSVYGFADADHGGHGEVIFTDARVPATNLIGGEGDGFAIAQARLGPGRIHHCMRLLGMGERALEMMCRRALQRTAFGGPLAEQGVLADWIAESRVRLEQLRLLVLKAAWLMDTKGNKGAHTEIQAIKITVPVGVEWIVDKAVQVHGAGGVSQDFPLASWWATARSLRLADGPDEVHRRSLARRELAKYR